MNYDDNDYDNDMESTYDYGDDFKISKYHKAAEFVANSFETFIEDLLEENDTTKLREFSEYIPNYPEININMCNMDKAKTILEVLKSKKPEEIKKILSYIRHSECGWQRNIYNSYNSCSRFPNRYEDGLAGMSRRLEEARNNSRSRYSHCKNNIKIESSQISESFSSIKKIFLHKEYGSITTYLFGYCLTAMFSSKLKQESLQIPYFLQIACANDSNTYRLIHEIVNICDVNTCLIENIPRETICDCNYYRHITMSSTQFTEKFLDKLINLRDIPIIIEGYENERIYINLLREVANIPGGIEKFGTKDRFNILPILICPAIKSQFKHIFSIDLTSLDIDNEYLELIQSNKQILASLAFELVINAKDYFKQINSNFNIKSVSQQNSILKKQNCLFDNNMDDHINTLRMESGHYRGLSKDDVINIGYITYFFFQFMEAFNRALDLREGTKFMYKDEEKKHPDEIIIIREMQKDITDSLFKLHNNYSPTLSSTVNINANCSNPTESKNIKRKGIRYAKNIVKYYQSYGVAIRVSDAEYKNDRYIFSVELLPGTDEKLISRYTDEVRRLLGIEFFFPDISSSSIKITASEKSLNENSLLKILESDKFRESNMEIPYAVGYDIIGEMFITDISENYHMLIGGASGSGKSSALHSLLVSIIFKQSPRKVKLLIFDFGSSGLKIFNSVPHMLAPVVNSGEIETARQYIIALKEEMEKRLHKLDTISEREYKRQSKKWASIVCVIDEFPAFIRNLTEKREYKNYYTLITNILERARKVKIHLIITAQDAAQKNIQIKNTNFGAGIALKCNNIFDSNSIIGAPDATNLYGKGAMCFKSNEHAGIKRLQGSYMPFEKIVDMLDTITYNNEDANNQYEDVVLDLERFQKPSSIDIQVVSPPDKDNHNLEKTVVLALIKGEISDNEINKRKNLSNNSIKSFCRVGYNKANRFLEKLAEYGIVGKQEVEKQGRPVDSDKAAEFLRERGYTINRIEKILNELAETWNEKGVSLITPNNIENTLNQLLPYFNDSGDKPIQSERTESEETEDMTDVNNLNQHPIIDSEVNLIQSSNSVTPVSITNYNLNDQTKSEETKDSESKLKEVKKHIQYSKANEYHPENHTSSNRNNIGNKNQSNNKKNHNH